MTSARHPRPQAAPPLQSTTTSSSQASGLSSKRQQRLDRKLGHPSGKGQHDPAQHSKITRSKEPRLPAVHAHGKHRHTHLCKRIHSFRPGLREASRISLHHHLLLPLLHALSLHHCSLILMCPTPFLHVSEWSSPGALVSGPLALHSRPAPALVSSSLPMMTLKSTEGLAYR